MTRVTVSSMNGAPYRQQIATANGVKFVADAGKATGGAGEAPNPHDYLLAALGACTNMTLQMYANRKGWDLREVKIDLTETPGGKKPAISKRISVKGKLDAEQLRMLKVIAEKCPVNKLITGEKDMESVLDLVV